MDNSAGKASPAEIQVKLEGNRKQSSSVRLKYRSRTRNRVSFKEISLNSKHGQPESSTTKNFDDENFLIPAVPPKREKIDQPLLISVDTPATEDRLSIDEAKKSLSTLLSIHRLLMTECLLKLTYSQHHSDVPKLTKVLDDLKLSSDLRSDVLLLVPSLISTLTNLGASDESEIREKSRAVLNEILKAIFSEWTFLDHDEMMASYFAQSASALRKFPQFDAYQMANQLFQ